MCGSRTAVAVLRPVKILAFMEGSDVSPSGLTCFSGFVARHLPRGCFILTASLRHKNTILRQMLRVKIASANNLPSLSAYRSQLPRRIKHGLWTTPPGASGDGDQWKPQKYFSSGNIMHNRRRRERLSLTQLGPNLWINVDCVP